MAELLRAVVRATAAATGPDDVLDRVAQLLVGVADWVLADRLDPPDLVSRVAAYGAGGPLFPPDGRGSTPPRRSSARSVGLLPALFAAPGRVLHLSHDELLESAAGPEPHRARQTALALAMGATNLLVIGLVARDNLVGVLSLGSRHRLDDEVVAELVDVGLHTGLALDAAKLLLAQRVVATALQTSLLPPLPLVPGLSLAARYVPATEGLQVGGDWYDAFTGGPAGDRLMLVVGDASGHDVAAAARMADLRNLLRAHAVDRDESPSAVVGRLERTAHALALDATATCVVGSLRRTAAADWELVWTSAGHLPPLLVRAGGATLLETAADLMLGVDPRAPRQDQVQLLSPGDVLVLYTDGLVEVRGVPLEDRLELLRSTAEGHAGEPPDHLAELLLRALGDSATDDVALLVLRVD